MVTMQWVCTLGGGDKKCIQGFCGETFGKVTTWKTDREGGWQFMRLEERQTLRVFAPI